MILAGDVGGTKTLIGLFEKEGTQLRSLGMETYPSEDFGALEEILRKFLSRNNRPALQTACFGVAGPVVAGHSKTTNLPWELDESILEAELQVSRVKLLNDLEAAAYAMPHLPQSELACLQQGLKREGNIAVIAAGTGLGEAGLYWDGKNHHAIASEGGHADFAPRNDLEMELLKYLVPKFGGHVSYERVLSGDGLYNIYQFLRDSGHSKEPAWLAQRLAESGDPPAVVSEAGLSGRAQICSEALNLFSSIYGAEAGNLVLKFLAVGGLYVAGGIAPKILPTLQNGRFIKGFTDKGRFSELMTNTEVQIALNPRAPLLGAAQFALRL
ncbi:MAG: glucokinase [Deltaproteobacteria bacterium]|nr:glucokinase [Deltaproteobacteria bacterium]